MPKTSVDAVHVPQRYPTSQIFVDEAGTKGGPLFVVGAVKLREAGQLVRTVKELRDRHGFHENEFKFREITRGTLNFYFDLIDELVQADARIAACVVDRNIHDPFQGGRPTWVVHAEVLSQLLVGCIVRKELVCVLMDGVSTPRGCALDDTVREMVNKRLNATAVVQAACLDSRCTDGLQVADLVASAILFDRKDESPMVTPKSKVAARLKAAFGVSTLGDQRTSTVNIATYKTSPTGMRSSRGVTKNTRRAG
ncbi:MAG: hypothetical protein JWM93_2982 [Frankiales bacterium]|nr:hypothetical protein [Frankiales bacterium]